MPRCLSDGASGERSARRVVSVIDLKKNPPRIVESHSVGQIPEGATFFARRLTRGGDDPKRLE